MQKVSCLILAMCISLQVVALNVDSLLVEKIHHPRPYLVINVTSTDCITCRAGAVKILLRLNGSDYKSKIVLLSDDKNMASYFNDNADIYSGYEVVYDKNLSRSLALGPSCTASLVLGNELHTFLFSNLNDDTLNYFKNSLDGRKLAPWTEKLKDSVMTDAADVYVNKEQTVFFNDRFQAGLVYKDTGTGKYIKPHMGDATLNTLYNLLKNKGMKHLADVENAKKSLRMFGMPMFTVQGMNAGDHSILIRLSAMTLDTTYRDNDTMINANAKPKIIAARNCKAGGNAFDIDSYDHFVFFDSVDYSGNVLWPRSDINYEVFNGHMYLAYLDNVHSNKTLDHGREIIIPDKTYIVDFECSEDGTARAGHVYPLKNYKGESRNLFFFRIDDQGAPVTVNNQTRAIYFEGTGKKILYSKLNYDFGETVSAIYDISVSKDGLKFVGITNKNTCVKCVYNLENQEMKMTRLQTGILYQSMKIMGDQVTGFRKDEAANEITIDHFTF